MCGSSADGDISALPNSGAPRLATSPEQASHVPASIDIEVLRDPEADVRGQPDDLALHIPRTGVRYYTNTEANRRGDLFEKPRRRLVRDNTEVEEVLQVEYPARQVKQQPQRRVPLGASANNGWCRSDTDSDECHPKQRRTGGSCGSPSGVCAGGG